MSKLRELTEKLLKIEQEVNFEEAIRALEFYSTQPQGHRARSILRKIFPNMASKWSDEEESKDGLESEVSSDRTCQEGADSVQGQQVQSGEGPRNLS